jgi:rhodanese-related sulfurtransferase
MEKVAESICATGDLLSSLEHCDKFFVLDVRNRDEFEGFRLEGRELLPAFNVPHFEMLELGSKDKIADSAVACVEQYATSPIPGDMPILSVCAKGDTSEYVAWGLDRFGYVSTNFKGGIKAWGEHYCTRAVVEETNLAIYQVNLPARGCLSCVAVSERKALVIDSLRHVQRHWYFVR